MQNLSLKIMYFFYVYLLLSHTGQTERCDQGSWRDREVVSNADSTEGSLKQVVAMATVLSHFSPEVCACFTSL